MKFDIIFIIEELGNGGQERQMYYLAQMLGDTYKIGIIPFRFNKEDKYFGMIDGKLPVEIIKLEGKGKVSKLREIRAIIKESNPAIVHSFCYHLNFATWLVSVGNGPVAFGGIRSRLIANYIKSRTFSFYSSLLFPYRTISNNFLFLNGLGFLPKFLHQVFSKTYCVHNGLDLSTFPYVLPTAVAGGLIRTSSISRLYGEKRIDILIDLIYFLKQRGIQIEHKHAGAGPLLEEMQKRVDDYGLQENFKFIGEAEDIGHFLSESDLFIHTAEIEGCPNVTMEAMACGKPVLSTNCGDTSLLVQHGINGFVTEVNNPKELEKFALLMINDVEMLREMGKQSRVLAEKNFSLTAYRDKILKLYKENTALQIKHTSE